MDHSADAVLGASVVERVAGSGELAMDRGDNWPATVASMRPEADADEQDVPSPIDLRGPVRSFV
jgi:hypothetical protein